MYSQNPDQVQLDGAGVIRLVRALSTARVTPFTHADWSGYSGATGDACMVEFHPSDAEYLARALRIEHWIPDHTVVILDEMGVTWNTTSPVNFYAWQVQVRLLVDVHDAGSASEMWGLDDRRKGPLRFEEQVAALPESVRSMIMACPEQARPYVLTGYLQQRDRDAWDKQERAASGQDNQLTPERSELAHDWGGHPR